MKTPLRYVICLLVNQIHLEYWTTQLRLENMLLQISQSAKKDCMEKWQNALSL
jgi:hypothetical protein